MNERANTAKNVLFAQFAGEERRFRLGYRQLEELERRLKANTGTIAKNFMTHDFSVRHLWTIIELGLEGGGMSSPEATALCLYYKEEDPPFLYTELAVNVLTAGCSGVPVKEEDKKKEQETKMKTESRETFREYLQSVQH